MLCVHAGREAGSGTAEPHTGKGDGQMKEYFQHKNALLPCNCVQVEKLERGLRGLTQEKEELVREKGDLTFEVKELVRERGQLQRRLQVCVCVCVCVCVLASRLK